jgi:hypothetical protein
MRDFVRDRGLQTGQPFAREDVLSWFRERYPLVKEGTIHAHLKKLSTNAPSRLHYGVSRGGDDDLFFQIDPSRFRLFDPSSDPAPIYPDGNGTPPVPPVPPVEDSTSAFAYEHDLRDYLARNLRLINPSLTLYQDEGINGVEFPVGGRFIDILALDADRNFVVIELKVSRGYDRVVGQLLRYMGWIEQHQADAGQSVKGVIVAKSISEDLRLACRRVRDVSLFEYELAVTLRPVSLAANE